MATWFDAPSSEQPSQTASPAIWPEILRLLDTQCHPLAQGLRLAGIRPPDEVDWDLMEDGRVSGKRAVIVWNGQAGATVLVDQSSGIPSGDQPVRPTFKTPHRFHSPNWDTA